MSLNWEMRPHLDMDEPAWVTAPEVTELLGVKRATVYAYASRGKIRTVSDGRNKRYLRADVVRLRALRDARAGHAAVAAGALRWGEPVLDSSLTELREDGHRYRGHAALELAEQVPYEQVAELLWGGELGYVDADAWSAQPMFGVSWRRIAALLPEAALAVDAMTLALPALAVLDPQRLHTARSPTLHVARRIIRALIAAIALPMDVERVQASLEEPGVGRAVLVAFGVRRTAAAEAAVQRALVLCADHELNPSSFAARVAASAGADLYACTTAALATLTGPEHGGVPARVLSLLEEIGQPERAALIVGERLRRGDALPGFGHPLYPNGDPRAAPLLRSAQALAPRNVLVRTTEALVHTMGLAGGDAPTLDVGLTALAAALRLPRDGATALFAVGRAAGWVAHVLEQREAGFILRPRARYIGG